MHELTINFESQTISARDLHEQLEVKSKYADWFKNMLAYGFVAGRDYETVSKNLENGGRTIEHYVSISMAKELCMLQRTPKGKEIRQYLIKIEDAWNTPEMVMSRALQFADKRIESLKQSNAALLADNERMKPKEIFADAVTASDTTILIRDLAKLIRQNGVDIGEKRLYQWMRENGFIVKNGVSPTQRAMEMNLFETTVRTIQKGNGTPIIRLTTKVTGKGQQYFVNRFLGGVTDD